MAHKTNVTLEKARLMDARWINTPFAFAQLGRDFSLLQQHVMIKVSDHLQDYVTQFFRDKRNLLPDDPLSLFDDVTLREIPPLTIPYSEFGVDVNNRKVLYDAINEVIKCTMKGVVIQNGEQRYAWINVFKQITTPITDVSDVEYRNGSVELYINEALAKYAFDMRRGYINHPSAIAQESTREYAPRLYFLVKHKLARGKKEATIKYTEVRKELGVDIIDKAIAQKDDVISRSLYPQFAKFCKYVLDPACEDINRMAGLNLLDITIKYEPIYSKGMTRGNPDSIRFVVELSSLGEYHKNPKKAAEHIDTKPSLQSPVAPTASRKRGRPRKQQPEDNTPSLFDTPDAQPIIVNDRVGEWQQLVGEYGTDGIGNILSAAEYLGTCEGKFAIRTSSLDDCNKITNAVVNDSKFRELLTKYEPNIKVGARLSVFVK